MDPEDHIIAESERALLNDNDYRITGSSHFILRSQDALRLLLRFRTRRPAEDETDSDEELEESRQRLVQTSPPVGKPQEAGSHLLMSGEFGRIGKKTASRRENVNIARVLTNPPALFCPASYKEDISGNLVPNCNGTAVALYNANIYSGQFSTDSSLYYTCAQDYKLRVYDMKAAPNPSADYTHRSTMKLINTIQGQPGRWTITDSHLSPDDQRYHPSSSLFPN
jgi:WD repeat-containing protein 23